MSYHLPDLLNYFCKKAHKNIKYSQDYDLYDKSKSEAITVRNRLYEIKQKISEDDSKYTYHICTKINHEPKFPYIESYGIYYLDEIDRLITIDHMHTFNGNNIFRVHLKTYNVCPLKRLCQMSIITNNVSTQSLPTQFINEIDKISIELEFDSVCNMQ